MNLRSLGVFLALTAPFAVVASPARADTAACTAAYSQAQSLRDAHKLRDARDQMHLCAAAGCPKFIVKECTTWLVQLETQVPTVVVSAKDGAGAPVVDATVSVDGAAPRALDGAAIELDPGPHTFSFMRKDGTKVDRPSVVLEGQKSQSIVATFAAPAAAPAVVPVPPPPLETAPPPKAASFWTTQRDVGAAVGGVGVVGIVLGSVFGSIAGSAASKQKTDCASPTACTDHAGALSEHSTASTDSTLSTVSFIAGGALLAGGVILFATGGKRAEANAPGSSTGFVVLPSFGPTGGMVSLSKGF